jgi:hypothetical protein
MSESSQAETQETTGSSILSFGIALSMYALCYGGSGFWSATGFRFLPSTAVGFGAGLILIVSGTLLAKSGGQRLALAPTGFLAGVCLIFFGESLLRSFNLLQGPAIRGEIVLLSLFTLLLLRYNTVRLLSLLCYSAPLILALCFVLTSKGQLIFTDDHATFFYRLAMLKENFPAIPFYSPHWNGGFDARDFFATGALNFFFLSSPALYLFPLEKIYSSLVAGILFVVVPGSVFLAAKIERLPAPAPAIAVALSVSTSLVWYRWSLHYGTMGFVTSASLIPLNLALASRVLSKEQPLTVRLALLFFVTTTLMLFWSPSGIAFVPAIALGICSIRRCCKKRFVKPLLLGLVLINIPWIMIFWSASKVSSYLGSGTAARVAISSPADTSPEESKDPVQVDEHGHKDTRSLSERIDLREALQSLRALANSSQPLLFLLFLPGLAYLSRGSRYTYLLTFVWLFFLGTFCVPLIPKLDLDRMLVFFTLCSCVPTAALLGHLFQRAGLSSALHRLLLALAFGFLLAGVLSSGAIVRNRSLVRYWFAGKTVFAMKEAIEQHHGGGRMLYSGFVLHELNHAHLAPLAHLTNVPLIASSYVHRHWKYTEVLPEEFLKEVKSGAVERYLELYNVSAIFAHERKWRLYFESKPDIYTKVWSSGRFTLYANERFSNNYFLNGSGEVLEQTSNSVRVRVDSKKALLKFTYFPFVTSSACELSGKSVSNSIDFIELSNCTPGEVVEIRSKGPLARIS